MKIIMLFISSIFFNTASHDIQVSYFKVYQDSKKLFVDHTFELEDILKTLKINESDLSNDQIVNYLEKHFSIQVNDTKIEMRFDIFQSRNKHITIKGYSSSIIDKVSSIKINNTCFLEIEGHSNIIEIRLNDQERDFLMNIDRTTIDIQI